MKRETVGNNVPVKETVTMTANVLRRRQFVIVDVILLKIKMKKRN
jgi:hypothetical protein